MSLQEDASLYCHQHLLWMTDGQILQFHTPLPLWDCCHKVYYSTFAEEVEALHSVAAATAVLVAAAAAGTVHKSSPPQ